MDYAPHLTSTVIRFAIEVHRQLGPGLLESAYEECLCCELRDGGVAYARQVPLPLVYKGARLEYRYRLDIVVANMVVVEVKAVDRLAPVHSAQMLTYLRLSGHKVGLLINFNQTRLKAGLRRLVL